MLRFITLGFVGLLFVIGFLGTPSKTQKVIKVAEAAPVIKVAEAAPVVKVADAAPVVKVAEVAPVVKVAETAPVVKVADAAPVVKVVEAAPVVKVADASPVVKVAEAASVVVKKTDSQILIEKLRVKSNLKNIVEPIIKRTKLVQKYKNIDASVRKPVLKKIIVKLTKLDLLKMDLRKAEDNLKTFEVLQRKYLPYNFKNPHLYNCKGPGAVSRKCIGLLKSVKDLKFSIKVVEDAAQFAAHKKGKKKNRFTRREIKEPKCVEKTRSIHYKASDCAKHKRKPGSLTRFVKKEVVYSKKIDTSSIHYKRD